MGLSDEKGKISNKSSRPYDNKVQSLGSREPRQAWGEGNQSDEWVLLRTYILKPLTIKNNNSIIYIFSEGGFLARREEGNNTQVQNTGPFSPVLGSRVISYADEDPSVERNVYDIPEYNEATPAPTVQVS